MYQIREPFACVTDLHSPNFFTKLNNLSKTHIQPVMPFQIFVWQFRLFTIQSTGLDKQTISWGKDPLEKVTIHTQNLCDESLNWSFVGCRAWQDSAQVPWGFLWYLEGCCANQATLYSQYFASFHFLALTHYGRLSFLSIVKYWNKPNLAFSDNEYGCNAVQLRRIPLKVRAISAKIVY